MKVNIERIHSRLEEIYQCGRKEDGTFTRMAYSPEDVKGRETFMNYFRKLGIEPRVDEAGNIHARLEGEDPSLPAILTGSHLDTVPDGGKYDVYQVWRQWKLWWKTGRSSAIRWK